MEGKFYKGQGIIFTQKYTHVLQLRSKYAAYLQEHGCMNQLMCAIFRLMPDVPLNKDKANIFEKAFCLQAIG